MLKYFIIPLANDAISFCHYSKGIKSDGLIPIELLQKAIFHAMKENLSIQFLYPDYTIPNEYKTVIDSIDHVDIVGSNCEDIVQKQRADIVAFDDWMGVGTCQVLPDQKYVVRTSKSELFNNADKLADFVMKSDRIVVVVTDIDSFNDGDFKRYEGMLNYLIPIVKNEYLNGRVVQLNMLTDRMFLDGMNNCNAGYESITLAPDGKFYICPAFYLAGSKPVGNIEDGIDIKNASLYHIDHAPICRNCDSYQCRRCVWLNKKTTLEVNTPSHEQCVVAHIERNASKKLLESIREFGEFLPDKSIEKIDYLDPFDNINKH